MPGLRPDVGPAELATATGPQLPDLARGPVLGAMAAVAVALTLTSARYGYHRDELYFRMLRPAWGYVDEPPLTPFLARTFSAVADTPWALRIPATIGTVCSIYVLALITREFGGGRGAQALCAWAYGFAAVPLIMGHVLLTSTIDLPVWPLVMLFIIRAQLRSRPVWWLAAGLVVGLSTYNKLLVAVLLVSIAVGMVLTGAHRLLIARPVLAAALLAVLVGLPNLLYQASNSWPQVRMGRALAANNATEVRISMWPFLLLMLGPPLVPLWIAGLVELVGNRQYRPVRFVAAAFPVLLLLVFVMGSQNYYPVGLVAVLFAVGCVPAHRWLVHGWHRKVLVTAVAINALVSVVLGLPLVAASTLGRTPVAGINQIVADSVGWPRYVEQVADVYDLIPISDRKSVILLASNYGEAGALDRFGARRSLPAVYSAQNGLADQGPPPDSASTAVFLGGQFRRAQPLFARCDLASALDNGLGVDNEEQGQPIGICSDPVGGWVSIWPLLRHLD